MAGITKKANLTQRPIPLRHAHAPLADFIRRRVASHEAYQQSRDPLYAGCIAFVKAVLMRELDSDDAHLERIFDDCLCRALTPGTIYIHPETTVSTALKQKIETHGFTISHDPEMTLTDCVIDQGDTRSTYSVEAALCHFDRLLDS